jgi:hypothetical protein
MLLIAPIPDSGSTIMKPVIAMLVDTFRCRAD